MIWALVQRKPRTVHFSAERLRFSVDMYYQMGGLWGKRGGTLDLREENPKWEWWTRERV